MYAATDGWAWISKYRAGPDPLFALQLKSKVSPTFTGNPRSDRYAWRKKLGAVVLDMRK
jgi:hypothetical protein